MPNHMENTVMLETTHITQALPVLFRLHNGIRYKHKFMVSKLIYFKFIIYVRNKKYTIITIKYFRNFICSDILLLQQQKTSEKVFFTK